jgi:2-methylisocitrate lyase-like PEP mutase family enzyme
VKFLLTAKVPVTDALFARLVQDCGYPAEHLSENAIHFYLPDRNLLTITQIARRVRQISEASDIPLIVDSGPICIATTALARTVKSYERVGAAAMRFEDSLVNEYGAPKRKSGIKNWVLLEKWSDWNTAC